MKKIALLLAIAFGFHTAVLAGENEGKVPIDTKSSTLHWVGEKLGGSHNGSIDIKSGSLELNGNTISGGSFEIDMTSITCADISNEEYNAKLVGHLKSNDFFAVSKHKTANFVITKAEANGHNYTITGNLTIKGIVQEVSFPAHVHASDDKIEATAEFKIDRTKWDIKFKSASFFDNLGDNFIYDDIQLKVKLVANK